MIWVEQYWVRSQRERAIGIGLRKLTRLDVVGKHLNRMGVQEWRVIVQDREKRSEIMMVA